MCQLARVTAASTRAVAASVVVVAVSAEVVSVEAVQLLLELLLVFLAKFPFLENYMFSPYIILVSNRLVGWYLMKF